MEKVVYFLLLDRKRRQPALKDSIPLRKRWKNRASSRETPHKRVDSVKLETSEPAAAPVSPQISGCVVRVLCVCDICVICNMCDVCVTLSMCYMCVIFQLCYIIYEKLITRFHIFL